jgi:hypothetical protein
MNRRRAGRAAEQRAVLALQASGARLVTTSHLSRGVVDVIGIFADRIVLAQIKFLGRGKQPGGNTYRDRRLLADLARELPECCSCELWTWHAAQGEWTVEAVGGIESSGSGLTGQPCA